jgi:large subunit ribosomal protein L35
MAPIPPYARSAPAEPWRSSITGDVMPKMKTKRGARKRLKRTASGKLMRAGGWKQHKLEAKSPKRRRRLRKKKLIDRADQARLHVLVPYL